MKKFLILFVALAGSGVAFSAHAEQLVTPAPAPARVEAPTDTLDVAIGTPLTIGYLSPTFGAVMLGVSPDAPGLPAPVAGSVLAPTDFFATYRTRLLGSQIGVSAGFMNNGSLFLAAPTAGWNLGASIGYAGFYLHGGISDAAQERLTNDPNKGWLAGFGYQTGGLNVRLSYMTAQTPVIGDIESRTWMLGGVYQLSQRLRLNADAFTTRDPHALTAVTPAVPATAAPQGTGARVGVQLRF